MRREVASRELPASPQAAGRAAWPAGLRLPPLSSTFIVANLNLPGRMVPPNTPAFVSVCGVSGMTIYISIDTSTAVRAGTRPQAALVCSMKHWPHHGVAARTVVVDAEELAVVLPCQALEAGEHAVDAHWHLPQTNQRSMRSKCWELVGEQTFADRQRVL